MMSSDSAGSDFSVSHATGVLTTSAQSSGAPSTGARTSDVFSNVQTLVVNESILNSPAPPRLAASFFWTPRVASVLLWAAASLRLGELDALQPDVRTLVQACAAALAVFPHAAGLLRAATSVSLDVYSDVLVLLGVVGSALTGEFGTAVLLPLVIDLGHGLEQRGAQRYLAATQRFDQLLGHHVRVLRQAGVEESVAIRDVVVGNVLVVLPGSVVPVDGEVEQGHSCVDEAAINGEPTPRDVTIGELVYAGSRNLTGRICVRAVQVGSRTIIGRTRKLLSSAINSKTQHVCTVEQFAAVFVPVVLLLGLVVLMATGDMRRAVSLLIVSCPCALLLAAPSAMAAVLYSANQSGILIRSSRFLESLADVDAIVFDKTGTLTEGRLCLDRLVCVAADDTRSLLQYAARCAAHSQHPICQAVTAHARQERIMIDGFGVRSREVPGEGVSIVNGQHCIRMGRKAWIESHAIKVPTIPEHRGPVVVVSRDNQCLGFLMLADRVRSDASVVIDALRQSGIKHLAVLTGDRHESAQVIASQVGVTHLIADARPDDKLRVIQELKQQSFKVAYLGDGLNDVLALSNADVGIAFVQTSDVVAADCADITILSTKLSRIVDLMQCAKAARRVINQNVLAAVASIVLLASASIAGYVTPLAGGVLHHGATCVVLLNSARLLLRSNAAGVAPTESRVPTRCVAGEPGNECTFLE